MLHIADLALQCILLLLFAAALVLYLRGKRSVAGEIPLMLGVLAAAVLIPTLGRSLGIAPHSLSIVGGILFFLQPYCLLRMGNRFTQVRTWVHWLALGWLIAASALLTLSASGAAALLVYLLYYVGLAVYTVFLFLRSAHRTRGVVRLRMLSIGVGTSALVLAVLVMLAAHGALAQSLRLTATSLALLTSLSYFAAFLPPAWLRRLWQLPEIERFIREAPKKPDVQTSLGELAAAALHITGARAVAAAQLDASAPMARLIWRVRQSEPAPPILTIEIPHRGLLSDAAQGLSGIHRVLDQLPDSMRSWAQEAGVQAYAAVPVGIDDRQIAFLLIFAEQGFLFAHDALDLLAHLARHTAVACENAQLVAAATREADRAATINRVISTLIRPMDPEDLARELLEVLADVVGADISELFAIDGNGRDLVRVARHPGDGAAFRVPIERGGLMGLALTQGEVIYSADVQSDDRFVRREESHREGYRSMLSVPLFSRGTPVGAYTLIHRDFRAYSPAEQEVPLALAAPIAAALQNSMLHSKAERHLRQYAMLDEMALTLSSERSVADLRQKIADSARLLAGASCAVLAILGSTGDIDQVVASRPAASGSTPLDESECSALIETMLSAQSPRRAGVSQDQRADGPPTGRAAERFVLEVPIAYGPQHLGTLCVARREDGAEFSAEDEWALRTLAAHAASAITSTQLFLQVDEARRAAEQANADLERASRAKSDFLASMSHELRTPLNAILGFTEILLDDPQLDTAKRSHFLETVHSSGRHLLSLINDILDLSKVEAGQMDLQPEDFDPSLAVQEVLTAVAPLAAQGGVSIEQGEIPPLPIHADRGKFRQILYNLVSNAIKFTEDRGRVQVEARWDDSSFILAVEDTGIGIAPEDQSRIFDAFQQVDSSSVRRYKGTGLGLALVLRFAELHGGHVTLRSAPGVGSRFEVHFPEAASSAALEPPAASHGPLILVVEDDARAQALLQHTLLSNGFSVAVAHSGEEALTKAKTLHPAAVTLDVILPGIDGWAVLELLKTDAQTRDVPVAVVTVTDDRRRAYALGATDFFVKPVDRNTLLDALLRYTTPPPEQVTVLAVDDEQFALDQTVGILREVGYQVIGSRNGAEALALARRSPPDLVILDLMMPGMNGFELLAELRRTEATSRIPVIVVSARELTPDDKKMLSGQVHAVLRKGEYEKADLISWMRSALRR